MGVAGAGKTVVGTAFARAIGVPFVEGDDFHPARNVEKMAAGIPLDDADRAGWLEALGRELAAARSQKRGVVIACSALKRSYRDALRAGAGAFVRFIYLRGDRALLSQRLQRRKGHFMPASLLDSQLATLEEPSADEDAWTVDVAATPDTIVAELVHCVMRDEERRREP